MRAGLRPLALYPRVALISCMFLLIAFLFLFLVSLSLPLIKTIYLVRIRSTNPSSTPLSIATELRFGVWGVCATGDLNQPTWYSNPGLCYGPRLGYDIPDYIIAVVGISRQVVDVVQKVLLGILVLHPIAAGLGLAAFLTSAFPASHGFSIFSLVLTIITAILSSVVLTIDIALVVIAKQEMKNLANFHFEVLYGNGVWMILVAVIFVWAAVVSVSARACYCLGIQRHPDDQSLFVKHNRERY